MHAAVDRSSSLSSYVLVCVPASRGLLGPSHPPHLKNQKITKIFPKYFARSLVIPEKP
eukprot:COSAG05_NODE_1018_length_6171_cov_6.038867_3_plen_58_part_00